MGCTRHGVDGWHLVEYAWSPSTGVGEFRYRRAVPGAVPEFDTVCRRQPALPSHDGWRAIN